MNKLFDTLKQATSSQIARKQCRLPMRCMNPLWSLQMLTFQGWTSTHGYKKLNYRKESVTPSHVKFCLNRAPPRDPAQSMAARRPSIWLASIETWKLYLFLYKIVVTRPQTNHPKRGDSHMPQNQTRTYLMNLMCVVFRWSEVVSMIQVNHRLTSTTEKPSEVPRRV